MKQNISKNGYNYGRSTFQIDAFEDANFFIKPLLFVAGFFVTEGILWPLLLKAIGGGGILFSDYVKLASTITGAEKRS